MSCNAIDDIWKCFQELESQGQLSVTAENYIEELKFFLRYVRVHVKWGILFSSNFLDELQSWIQFVEIHLIQPTRNGSMAADVLEEKLNSFLLNIHSIKEALYFLFSDYYRSGFASQDMLIDELVMDWLDPLLENLKHLKRCGDLNLHLLPKEQIKELEEKLISLRNFLKIIGKEGLLDQTSEDLLSQVKFLIGNAIHLSYVSWMQRKIFYLERFFFELVVKISHIEPDIRMTYAQFLKASKVANPSILRIDIQALAAVDSLVDNLTKLLKDQDAASIMLLDLHQIEVLNKELSFLKCCLMDPYMEQIEILPESCFNSLLIQMESLARQAASLTHSICAGQTKNHMADMNLLHSDLLKLVNLLKAEFRKMYLRVEKPSFPQTPKSGFLDSFMQRLDELLMCGADSIAYVKNAIETLQTSLCDVIKNPEKDENIARRVIDLAYEAEHVIDMITASHFPRWFYMLWLSDINEKVKLLRKESIDVCGQKTCNVPVLNVEKASMYRRAQDFTPIGEEDVVGFDDEAEKIIDLLLGGPKELDIVSIIGMAGQGKTTLAKNVYKHTSITKHFHVRAWYCISQSYEKLDLLTSILCDAKGVKIKTMKEDEAEQELYKCLKGMRYLVVLDDIWSMDPWNDICISFPNDCNGSRILFTSRIQEVASKANPRSVHKLPLLSDDKSWELLCNKVFKQRSCPPGLHEIGNRIAKNCKGLPLSVVVISGILKTAVGEDQWRQILESLEKQEVSVSEKCGNVLVLSYNHLPDHLRPCFLYLGAFPEDKEISVWKLVRLWIAEGLVQKTKFESLEEVAEGYLNDLVSRNLVLVAKNKYNGGIKSCYLHDLWHEFSIGKAKDEKFFLLSQKLVDPEQYRHCFYCPEEWLYRWVPNYPYVRSMFWFPTRGSGDDPHKLYSADLSVLPFNLKLLRVLNLEFIIMGEEFPKIEFLVHLRYLALKVSTDCIPSSIGKLWRLETLIVKKTMGGVKLPETLLEMAYLKHLYVSESTAFELSDSFEPEKSFESDGIEKLTTLVLRCNDGTTQKVLRRLTSLRKLKCIFLDNSWCCNSFQVLGMLSKLESLNVTCWRRMQDPFEISFPSNLRKLTLSHFRLPWSNISKIGRLPQLEVLKLRSKAFEGPEWDVSDDEFRTLKVLELESLDIVEWYASCAALPCLEKLVLQSCVRLKDIPCSFEESNMLEVFEVKWCSVSATEAARNIGEALRDLRGDGLIKVLIQSNRKSKSQSYYWGDFDDSY